MQPRFQLHHWDPDMQYTTPEQGEAGEESLELEFEAGRDDWHPLTPVKDGPARTLHFVDGARRHDAAGTLGDHPCLFTAIGVGSVTSTYGTRVTPPDYQQVRRFVIIASDEDHRLEPVVLDEYGVSYTPHVVSGTRGDQQVAAAAQALMLAWEADHALQLAQSCPDDLVIVDGPLRRTVSRRNVLGYVKTTQRELLPDPQRAVLSELRPGQRTPVYRVHAGGTSLTDRLEWVIRPRRIVPGVDPRLGLVRVQADSALPLTTARELADWSAAVLPEYSTDYHHDSRAPQQLLLIKNLENDMRRAFGSRELVQAALREKLA